MDVIWLLAVGLFFAVAGLGVRLIAGLRAED